jgi:pilus assembly protein CpaF
MRPDRVIVGEVRDSSALDMLQAMNTGHEGSLTTVHANNASGAVERLALLVSQAGEIGTDGALSSIAGGVDLFVVIERYEDGSRRVKGIYEVPSHLEANGNKLSLTPIPLFEFVHDSTDEYGTVIGYYEKMNDISESLIRKHRMDKKRRLTLEEIYQISDVEIPGELK